ncbi:MAG: hypothetical protein RIT14_1282, partial [Pseudomonadota bacterium]
GPAPSRRRDADGTAAGTAMTRYFQTFRTRAEVADLLLLGHPERRLLVDLSPEPARPQDADPALPRRNPYPQRTTYTLTDPDLIDRFLRDIRIGDVIEAAGDFTQSDYIPHRTTCIDTTFRMSDFRRLTRAERPVPAPATARPTGPRRPLRLH